MKKILSVVAALLVATSAFAQDETFEKKDEGFKFTTVKEIPITSIKNQHRSSTCWSFSSMAFFEAEVLREKNITVDLSEMFLVSHTMVDRGELYVRLHGNATFAPGGAFSDGIYLLRNYGLVPQSAMPGLAYAEYPQDTLPVHAELDAVAKAFISAIAERGGRITPSWKIAFQGIYDAYLGKYPESFDYEGKQYTPQSFAKHLGLNPDDYVSITSFNHHPFYTQFAIEIEDNWRHSLSYNVPLDEFNEIVDYAVKHGYTVAWGADVSEEGFTRDGVAVVPDASQSMGELGSDMVRWLKLSKLDTRKQLTSKPLPEREITQQIRQQAFDNFETTDDHGMLIYGVATDQNGKEYYMVKNSWGITGKYDGIWYVSKAYVSFKTINILVNKKAIPASIARKLGIK